VPIDRPAEDWLDAPLLYVASHDQWPFTEPDDERLGRIKRFIEFGGLLVISPDVGNRKFVDSIVEALEGVYPHKFQDVPADDALRDIVYPLPNAELQSMHNGVRHLAVVIPADSSLALQIDRQRDATPWQVMANLYQYAIGRRRPSGKLDRIVSREPLAGADRTFTVARVRHPGNWNPEPLGYAQLDRAMRRKVNAAVTTQAVDITDLSGDMKFAHVVGTTDPDFTEAHVRAVRDYVADGGTILLEAAGGGHAFATAARRLLVQAWPEARIVSVPADHPILSGEGLPGGTDSRRVSYTTFYQQRLGGQSRPVLQAVFIDGQPRALLSAEDLNHGLLGSPVWGVFGYDSESARNLLANMINWAHQDN